MPLGEQPFRGEFRTRQPAQARIFFRNDGRQLHLLDLSFWVPPFDPADLPPLAAQDGLAAADRRYGSGEKLPWQEATFDLKDVEAVDTYARAYSYFTGVGEPFVPLTESRELMRVLVACRADAVDNVKQCTCTLRATDRFCRQQRTRGRAPTTRRATHR